VIRDAAVRFLLAVWELIMDFVKPQDSREPPVNTGMQEQGPDLDVASAPSPKAESEAVASGPSLQTESEAAANSIGLLLERVAGSSIDEIDRLTAELQVMRDMLQAEAARIEHQIMEYAHLNQSAMQTTKIIADHLASHRTAPDKSSGEDDAPRGEPSPQEEARPPAHHPQAAARRGVRPYPVRVHHDQARLG
jgi:hypothetical protein